VANHKSAEKRFRQTERRTAVNRARVSRIRTFTKKVESAIALGDKAAAAEAFKEAQPELMRDRAVSKGTAGRSRAAPGCASFYAYCADGHGMRWLVPGPGGGPRSLSVLLHKPGATANLTMGRRVGPAFIAIPAGRPVPT